jgi:hypothetical protein
MRGKEKRTGVKMKGKERIDYRPFFNTPKNICYK